MARFNEMVLLLLLFVTSEFQYPASGGARREIVHERSECLSGLKLNQFCAKLVLGLLWNGRGKHENQ